MNPWTPLVVATLAWSLATVITRALLENGVDAFAIVPARMVFAVVTVIVVVAISPRFQTPGRDGWLRGGVLGVVSVVAPTIAMTIGFEDVPVSIGGLLIALIPISTILAAHFLVDDERFNPKSIPGLLVSLVGSAVLVGIGGGDVEGVTDLWRGVGFICVGVILAGIGGALNRRFAQAVKSENLVLPQFVIGAVASLALIPLTPSGQLASWTGADWALIALMGVLGTGVAHTAFLMGAEINPAWRLAITGYAVPVFAIILAIILLGESLTLPIVIGAVLIIGGVVMVEMATDHHPEPGMATSR